MKILRAGICLMILLFTETAQSQTVILERNVTQDTTVSNFGPNRRHYLTVFYGLDTYAGIDQNGLEGVFNSSFGVNFGLRYKLQYSEHIANVFDLSYHWQSYGFNRKANVVFPDSLKPNHESFNFHLLCLSAFFRINYGHRGENIGKYIDVGATGGWIMADSYSMNNIDENGKRFNKQTFEPSYVRDFVSFVNLKAGFNGFAVTAQYRLDNFFKPASYTPVTYELPRLRAGIEFSF